MVGGEIGVNVTARKLVDFAGVESVLDWPEGESAGNFGIAGGRDDCDRELGES